MNKILRSIVMVMAVSVLLSGIANAQWVFVGRKALGKVKQMTGGADTYQRSLEAGTQDVPQQGYDAATVLLEAPAGKVYSTAIVIMSAKTDIRIRKRDDSTYSIEFTQGNTAAGMQITSLSENLSQLLVVSALAGKADSSMVVKAVMRICKEMGIHCQASE